MGCCQDKSFKSEEEIREIVQSLKITKLTPLEIDTFIKENSKGVIDKDSMAKKFSKLFYDEDKMRNPNYDIHHSIFEEIFKISNEGINTSIVEGIAILVFPLLKKTNIPDYFAFIKYLKSYSGEFYSYEKLEKFFIYLFEFYTIIINKCFITEGKTKEIKENAKNMNTYYFTYDQIIKKVDELLINLNSQKNKSFSINTDNIIEFLEKRDIIKFTEIRDFILD
jgi:hypothetical protein